MPEIGEEMYCSQQICIPPTFPYLLRQFAKAAIRTQPNDLLKWATTYFRCLSLNVPPPVKPRLEYPIPRDHHGLTPGWLRALLHQMAGYQTVGFKVLWDRWIGACLQHPNLIQILVLGGFDDNTAVPWLRFVGLCAAHLTDNLTQTMILICEILTEEPEGGSAMISLEIFIDLYQFLARIDASVPQTLKNYYFLDKFLELYQEKIARDSGQKQEEEEPEEFFEEVSSESTLMTEKETKKEEGSVISCPSVTSQDPDNYMRLLMKIQAGDEFEEEEPVVPTPLPEQPKEEPHEEPKEEQVEEQVEPDESKREDESTVVSRTFTEQLAEDKKASQFPIDDDMQSRSTRLSSEVESKRDDDELKQDKYLMEDLQRLRSLQEEMFGESDHELEKFKADLLAEVGLTQSQLAAPEHFETKIEEESESLTESAKTDETSTSEPSEKEKPPELPPEALTRLHSIFGPTLSQATELLETCKIAQYETADKSRCFYKIGSNLDRYTLYKNINFCQCRAFQTQVLEDATSITCKHVLALKLNQITQVVNVRNETITDSQFVEFLNDQLSNVQEEHLQKLS